MTADAIARGKDYRRHLYAEGAAVLDQDEHVAGAEAPFDEALTNGLLVIVAAHWPEATTKSKGSKVWTLPADMLLQVLEDRAHFADGFAYLPTERPVTELAEDSTLRTLDTNETVLIHVDQLRGAVARTQQPRHGRGPGRQVTRDDVAALLALDDHPALHVLHNHYLDERWRRAQVADLNEHARAASYLALLPEEERTHRVEAADAALGPTPGDIDTLPQECPVCGHETLASIGSDDFGYGITAGTCWVCSYQRSADIAYDLGMDIEWEVRWTDF
ncbi:hypothetical protein [Geodermatophilus sp. URMC 62]|uniref:hypothetical protein n=1 Tax=Geodermatophilus sp. URMC 62 TaxID=3423414 RepID=UPI00406CA865